jgi:hypothetical protein
MLYPLFQANGILSPACCVCPSLPAVLDTTQRFYRLVSDRRLWLVVSPSGVVPETAPGIGGPVHTTIDAAVKASRWVGSTSRYKGQACGGQVWVERGLGAVHASHVLVAPLPPAEPACRCSILYCSTVCLLRGYFRQRFCLLCCLSPSAAWPAVSNVHPPTGQETPCGWPQVSPTQQQMWTSPGPCTCWVVAPSPQTLGSAPD